MACFALLDDAAASAAAPSSRLYTGYLREHRCDDPAQLAAVWAAADRELRAGHHALILADYEWGARLQGAGDLDLAPADAGALRFLIFERLEMLSASQAAAWLLAQEASESAAAGAGATAAPGIRAVRASVDWPEFSAAIRHIHAAIGEGETYQVNYTYRLDFSAVGSPAGLYRRLRARQPVAFGAYIALPGEAGHVLSCSPELFLRHQAGSLVARPMKGTSRRSPVPEGDSELARTLAEDTKNRAENLMIVDLLRNDLGRIATTGSVRVPALFSVEPYATLFQMTSTVEAELPAVTDFPAVLRALFPCGSIAGAPKLRTMEIIRAIESTPRGLYTGGIGWIDAPAGARAGAACGDFCLSVAIRTLVLGPAENGLARGRMGVGAGIVIDSVAADEFAECALKARFLTGLLAGAEAPAIAPEAVPAGSL